MKIKKLLLGLCFLIAVATSIKSFREPDLWWQIRTGEWILEHHEVPKQDIFSYTMNGTEWINIKWGFEVMAALIADHLGTESVFILQAIVNCLLLIFLFRLTILFFRQRGIENPENDRAFLISGVIAFLVMIVGTEYRMIGRPEMTSHLLTIVFLYVLEKNRYQASKQIYFLIPLQMLWANMHEAFGIGLVILIIYSASAWLSKIFSEEKKTNPFPITITTFAALVSVIINPNGFRLLMRPFNIMSQVYSNKYTTELLDFTASDWWKKEAYIGLLLSALSIVILLLQRKKEKHSASRITNLFNRLNNPYLIVILAFVYLGLSAYRNLVFLSLVCFPVFHYSLFTVFKKWFSKSISIEKYSGVMAIIMLILFYTGIVSNRYYKLTKSRDRFGLEVLSVNNPTGAADYILKNNLESKKCFSDYLTSSYLLWRLRPKFQTYIDLRDLDIFPPGFFTGFLRDVNSPEDYHRLDSVQHFDYAVVFRPQFDALHYYLYNDSIYALKYVDAVAAVYEKTDSFTRDDIFSPCRPVKAGAFATAINKLLNPFYTPYDYSSVETDYIAANYYLTTGRFDLAKKRAEALVQDHASSYKGNELLAQLYYRSSLNEPSDSSREVLLSSAEDAYHQSLATEKNYAPAWLGLGTIHLSQKNYAAAIKDFSKCIALDEDNYQAHLSVAQCYRELVTTSSSRKEEYRAELLSHFLKANALNPGNPMIEANIGFVYFQMNDCDHAVQFLSLVSEEKSLSPEDQASVKNCLRQCGN